MTAKSDGAGRSAKAGKVTGGARVGKTGGNVTRMPRPR